jgi:beta-lactamase regulating signal transducer with metallopeptidase domain
MLVLWVAYALALTAIIAGGALAIERLAAIWNVPLRAVWTCALAAAMVVPVALSLQRDPVPDFIEVRLSAMPALSPTQPTRVSKVVPAPAWPRFYVPAAFSRKWDARLSVAWMIASALLLALFIRGIWIVRRRREEWQVADVDGHSILIAEDAGPAVVGALRPEIVLPAWTLLLDHAERELVLRHESEHVAAKDPLLLTIAGLSLVLFPWNAALWLIVRRLRLAVEIDCDARVLRSVPSPREYGMLLLTVGARRSLSLPMAASLTERQPDLERRIIAMTSLRPSRPLLASIPLIGIATIAATVAAETPHPGALFKSAAPLKTTAPAVLSTVHLSAQKPVEVPVAPVVAVKRSEPRSAADVVVKSVSRCCTISRDTLAVWMAAHHADVVNGSLDADIVIFVVDNEGHYVTSRARPRAELTAAEVERRVTEKLASIRQPDQVKLENELDAQKRAREEKLRAEAKLASIGADSVKVSSTASAEQIDAAAQKLKMMRDVELSGILPDQQKKQALALDGMNVPPESIQSVNVLKLPGGQMAPGPIGIVTVFLKP